MTTLRKQSDETVQATAPVALPSVNLLPPEVRRSARLRQTQRGLGCVVLAAMVIVALLWHQSRGSVSSAQERVTTAVSNQASLQTQMAQFKDVTATYTRASAAQMSLVQAMSAEVRYSRLLNDLSLSIPARVWLTTATWSQPDATSPAAAASTASSSGLGTVTFGGVAMEYGDVAVWLEALGNQTGYDAPYLTTSTAELIGGRPTVNWTATVNLTSDALSGRYVAASG